MGNECDKVVIPKLFPLNILYLCTARKLNATKGAKGKKNKHEQNCVFCSCQMTEKRESRERPFSVRFQKYTYTCTFNLFMHRLEVVK